QAAVRAVADVQADELVAPAADPQVLRRSQQRRVRGGEREGPGDGEELLARLAIGVHGARLDVGQSLPARRRRPQSVDLAGVVHRERDTIANNPAAPSRPSPPTSSQLSDSLAYFE